ncbi:ADP-dependent NAD(P)H-hydrate dehydratase [Steroidobacter denitrificans]|uniref:Bifunctional NAD(P)H-hydrate repair enzyme n=1 Tax=Steroidobacter denitrificans TaxID=465721 RepID=A0A127F9R8_STEDE|nr:bifunctional ADP-dependent NAD(P)H-hydrate dehydratase/NAD(P)H-hydrate epimerase [Steroidobacter denitrificans]AMN46348.1 ADP-dependent NAD(P)H-hydrate dehydratase [Steroidobacter denitrificans]
MSHLPIAIHTAAQVRALDRHAIDDLGIPSYVLMTRAGEAGLALLRRSWPDALRILVLCGPGNNGGDGYVLARAARMRGMEVSLIALSEPRRLGGDARRAYEDFIAAGGAVLAWDPQHLAGCEVIVDAIFGTGLMRPVEGDVAAAIHRVNASGLPVLALDIPSGLHADTGEVLGGAIMARCSLSFIGLKLGFYLGAGPDHAGVVHFDALGLPETARTCVDAAAHRVERSLLARVLPRRTRLAHKMQQGSVLVIGGGPGMAGAARMTGEAALRVGAGLVSVATHPQNVTALVAARPELICRGVEQAADLEALIQRADVLALGPGLGQDDWARALAAVALASGLPMVIDADGLNLLAHGSTHCSTHRSSDTPAPETTRPAIPGQPAPPRGAGWILTPHPGEAGRLLGCSTAQVQADRLEAAQAIAERYVATVVLKGAGSLIAAPGRLPSICDRGNPGMASAGMGDVLTGVIAGIAAQYVHRLPPRTDGYPEAAPSSTGASCAPMSSASAGGQEWLWDAARAGVLVHAMAGDEAAGRGERGLIATDLFAYLPLCVNPVR